MDTAAIQTHGLTRRFGELTAVENVTLSVTQGQFFGFLGPNGAGKSTTIKMLTGLLEPSAGTIEILGQPFSSTALELKRQIGVVPEGMALLGRLTAPEYLRFVGRMYGLDRETVERRTDELLEFMQLANERRKMVTDFSHGMQKKLALGCGVIHGPKVLFLDEPFEGVDAIAAGMLKAMLQGMIQRGATIFLTTHVLEIVERLCSHVAIIHQGGWWPTGRSRICAPAWPPRCPRRRHAAHPRRDFSVDRGSGRQRAGAGTFMADLEHTVRSRAQATQGGSIQPTCARTIFRDGLHAHANLCKQLSHRRWRLRVRRAHRFLSHLCLFRPRPWHQARARSHYSLLSIINLQSLPIEFWVVFVLWQAIAIALVSFQEQFDFGSLLRFPVNFGSFFLLHLIFGLVDASTLAGGLACVGLLAGISIARPDLFAATALALLGIRRFQHPSGESHPCLDRSLARQKEIQRNRQRCVFDFDAELAIVESSLRPDPGFRHRHHINAPTTTELRPWVNVIVVGQAWLPPGLASAVVRDADAHDPTAVAASMIVLGVYLMAAGGLLGLRLRAEYRGESLGEAPSLEKNERRETTWHFLGFRPRSLRK